MAGERTEAPTPKRRTEARRRGQVARSQDLSSVLVLLGGLLLLRFAGGGMVNGLADLMTGAFRNLATDDLSATGLTGGGGNVLWLTAKTLLPLLLGLAAIAVAVSVLQTGPLLTTYPLRPQLHRINPAAGTRRLFSKDALVALIRNLLKVAIVGGVVSLLIRDRLPAFTALGNQNPAGGAREFSALTFDVLIIGAGSLLAVGLVDFLWQRRRYLQELRMTKEELREELKQSEGNPAVKGRMRQLRRDFFNRMMASVPKATVVVTNPTHIAVALRYDPLEDDAPVVVAKGQRLIAERIKEIAREHGIPLWEDQPLARVLYQTAPIGKPIPAPLYQAVAEVLAFLFRLRAGLPGRPPGPHHEFAAEGTA